MGDGSDENHHVRALLICWADWKRRSRWIMAKWPKSTLGRLVRAVRQGSEIWQHNQVWMPDIYDDAAMNEISRIIAELPGRQSEVIQIEYGKHEYQPQKWKADRLGMSERHYRRLLAEAHEIIDSRVDWRNILVA